MACFEPINNFCSLFLGLMVIHGKFDFIEDFIPEVVVACGLGGLVRITDVHVDVEVSRVVSVVVFQSKIDPPSKPWSISLYFISTGIS